MTDEMLALCVLSGANSIFIGDTLLTAPNSDEGRDNQLLRRLGMQRTETRTMVADHG
jgi:biotin synthase